MAREKRLIPRWEKENPIREATSVLPAEVRTGTKGLVRLLGYLHILYNIHSLGNSTYTMYYIWLHSAAYQHILQYYIDVLCNIPVYAAKY
jgi:hypothetical protein